MRATTDSTPFYKKLAFSLFNLTILIVFLYVGQGILIPLFFSILLATLLLPVTQFFQRRKINRVFSILITLVFALMIITAVFYFLGSQVANFLNDMDTIKERLEKVFLSLQQWVKQHFNMTIRKQDEYINQTVEKIKTGGIVVQTIASLTTSLSYVVFLPVYTFLLLYYKELIKKFLVDVFKNGAEENVREILHVSRSVSQHFIVGLMIEMSIVFTLNATGFLILGIKYALFLALVAALLNLVPYIGMLVANVFCMLITLVSSENIFDVLWVGAILAVVQFIDNNFLMPLIVGSKVRINALVTLLGVLIGGALCGIPGMFLSIPGLAVLKVIFDRVDGLKPFGTLLGADERPEARKSPNIDI